MCFEKVLKNVSINNTSGQKHLPKMRFKTFQDLFRKTSYPDEVKISYKVAIGFLGGFFFHMFIVMTKSPVPLGKTDLTRGKLKSKWPSVTTGKATPPFVPNFFLTWKSEKYYCICL